MDNKKALKTLQNVEDYITSSINEHYDPIKVKQLLSYDKTNGTMIGAFVANNKNTYTFYISQDDGLPMLKPVVN